MSIGHETDLYLRTSAEWEKKWVKPTPGKALVVGSRVFDTNLDRRKFYPDAIGIDMDPGEGVDHVCNLENDLPFYLGPFSHVDCASVIEHCRRPWLMAQNIEYLLPAGGSLFVRVPFIWRIHSYPSDYWRMTPEGVASLFPAINWGALELVHAGPSQRKVPSYRDENLCYMARSEVHGFGLKRGPHVKE